MPVHSDALGTRTEARRLDVPPVPSSLRHGSVDFLQPPVADLLPDWVSTSLLGGSIAVALAILGYDALYVAGLVAGD